MERYKEKQQAKLEKYERLARKNRKDGNIALESVRTERQAIPFGQPILVGHHSEKRHRSHLERLDNREAAGFELLKKAEYYERKVENIRNPIAISGDDPDAAAKLERKLAKLENKREAIKEYNRNARKQGTEPCPAYKITNLGANIRRIKQRIADIKEQSAQESSDEIVGDVRIAKNVEDNRLQMFFPGKPPEEIRKTLKQNGFRWSPRNECWQRHLSDQAERLALSVARESYHG